MKIKSIIIVGGGTAGWFSASIFSKMLPNIDVTLIESDEYSTIGVGESTLGFINRFFIYLGLKDEDWMRHCDATYKVSIEFSDFYKKGTKFQYPFGIFEMPSEFKIMNHWLETNSLYPDIIKKEDFTHFLNYNSWLATYNKLTDEKNERYELEYDTAYHFDAKLIVEYLKNNICSGVKHHVGTVNRVKSNEYGVTSIVVNGEEFSADLYIDCTGFKSLLIGDGLGVDFVDFKHLINDTAIIGRAKYKNEDDHKKIRNTTLCTGADNGWIWDIPLWSKRSSGYVFSSKFADIDSIEKEFIDKTGCDEVLRKIDFRHGYRKKAFYKNVFAVGLSYGFIEPLESTGLLTIHENLITLVDMLVQNDCEVNNIDREIVNEYCKSLITGMADFVSNHYFLSKRNDTEYWRYLTDKFEHQDTNHFNDVFRRTDLANFIDNLDGLSCILIAMNYNPINKNHILKNDKMANHEYFINSYKNFMSSMNDKISNLPSTYEFLKNRIYY